LAFANLWEFDGVTNDAGTHARSTSQNGSGLISLMHFCFEKLHERWG